MLKKKADSYLRLKKSRTTTVILRPFGVVLRDNLKHLNKTKHYTHLDTQEL